MRLKILIPMITMMTQDLNIKMPMSIVKLQEGEWTKWLREVGMVLRAQQGWMYVTRRESEPKDGTPEKTDWLDTNDQIVRALGTAIEASLQRELEVISNAKSVWDKLKEKTHVKGIIEKLSALTYAIQNPIMLSIPASTTITKIKDALTSVFKGSAPMQEEWLIVLLLNALADGEYNWL